MSLHPIGLCRNTRKIQSPFFLKMTVFTGENVVRGDKESVKNLLEIFDGLLEYLKEEISEESQNGGRQICLSLFPHLLVKELAFLPVLQHELDIMSPKPSFRPAGAGLIQIGQPFSFGKTGHAFV